MTYVDSAWPNPEDADRRQGEILSEMEEDDARGEVCIEYTEAQIRGETVALWAVTVRVPS